MSRVIIVGDIYYADLYPGNALPGGPPGHVGNRPPGSWGGPTDPGFGQGGGHPSQPIYHPGHPSHGLPSQPGHPSQPIYHPGHPSHGLPSGGAHPDQGLPIDEQIDNALPDGEEIQIDNELPPVPPEYADKVIVGIKKPDEEWVFKAYDDVSAGTPLPPVPQPKPTPTPTPQKK